MKNTKWPGEWKVVCHVCGMWYSSSEISKRWDGLLVCKKDYETRHPQTLTKARSRASVPPFISDEPEDLFVLLCSTIGSTAFAGLAEAGCAKAGNQTPPYIYLV